MTLSHHYVKNWEKSKIQKTRVNSETGMQGKYAVGKELDFSITL
jgi:hypothetical protein